MNRLQKDVLKWLAGKDKEEWARLCSLAEEDITAADYAEAERLLLVEGAALAARLVDGTPVGGEDSDYLNFLKERHLNLITLCADKDTKAAVAQDRKPVPRFIVVLIAMVLIIASAIILVSENSEPQTLQECSYDCNTMTYAASRPAAVNACLRECHTDRGLIYRESRYR